MGKGYRLFLCIFTGKLWEAKGFEELHRFEVLQLAFLNIDHSLR